jgi:HEAT repeat protein
VIAYCMTCWSEIPASDLVCPVCGKNVTDDSKSFDQKLLTAFDHPLPDARVRICWLAGRRKMREAVPPLLRLLRDPDLYVRLAALEALGEIGDAVAVPPIESAARERSVLIRKAARRALLQIRTESLGKSPG